jgi:hypothetical protein
MKRGRPRKSYDCVCKTCGKEFTTNNKAEIRRNHKQYCSIDCKLRKYTVNVNYLDDIDSTKSYWIGFIFGSGYVKSINEVKVFSKSKETLERFNIDFNSTYPIRNSRVVETKEVRYVVVIRGYEIVDKLIDLGMIMSDNSKLKIPDVVDQNDFIRGYIDSDRGFIYKEGESNVMVIHSQSITLLNGISRILKGKIYINKNEWSLIIQDSQKYYDMIYNNHPMSSKIKL